MKNKLTIYILSLQIEKEEPPPGALRTRLVGRVTLRSVLILVDIVCEYCFLKLNNSRKTNLWISAVFVARAKATATFLTYLYN